MAAGMAEKLRGDARAAGAAATAVIWEGPAGGGGSAVIVTPAPRVMATAPKAPVVLKTRFRPRAERTSEVPLTSIEPLGLLTAAPKVTWPRRWLRERWRLELCLGLV